MSKRLPSNPNLENLKKQAKQLVKDHKDGQVDAFTRIKASFPPLAKASVHEILAADFLLGHAQLVIAREYGYATWKELVEAVQRRNLPKVGRSPVMRKILEDIARLQQSSTTSVLIKGENGTGKELIARSIHFGSPRAEGPFVTVNCASMPAELLAAESLLFGHVKGAFTGADEDRMGYFEMVDGGTLFLDELDEMPAELQAKLLRALEERQVMPVGGAKEIAVDVRVLAATNVDAGRFRQGLIFRLAQFSVSAPPLRERQEDIPLLAQHFLQLFAAEMGRPAPDIAEDALVALAAYPFPGNIRELKNIIERALINCEGGTIEAQHLYMLP